MKPQLKAAFVAVALTATACSGSSDASSAKLTVYAAASLQQPFTELEKTFEKAHKGVDVRFNFAGSSKLAEQIDQGAPADVFAAADQKSMASVTKDVDSPQVFTSNVLEIAVGKGNPKKIKGLKDLASKKLTVVICAAQVPCGRAADTTAKQQHVKLHPASEEQDVKSVLTKVITGDADAGVVYHSDVVSAKGKVDGVAIKGSKINKYPIGAVKASKQAKLAKEFVALVRSKAGQQVLTNDGFGTH